jgi:hypothetical protein
VADASKKLPGCGENCLRSILRQALRDQCQGRSRFAAVVQQICAGKQRVKIQGRVFRILKRQIFQGGKPPGDLGEILLIGGISGGCGRQGGTQLQVSPDKRTKQDGQRK